MKHLKRYFLDDKATPIRVIYNIVQYCLKQLNIFFINIYLWCIISQTFYLNKWKKVFIFVIMLLFIKYCYNIDLIEISFAEEKEEISEKPKHNSVELTAWQLAILILLVLTGLGALYKYQASLINEIQDLKNQVDNLTINSGASAQDLKNQVDSLDCEMSRLKHHVSSTHGKIEVHLNEMNTTVDLCLQKNMSKDDIFSMLIEDYEKRNL